MSENKWVEFSSKIENLLAEHKKVKKERDRLAAGLNEFKKQTAKLAKGNKEDVLLKARIGFLEEERKLVQEKVRKLLKILREY